MAEPSTTPLDLAHQLHAHLASWQSAGVVYVPLAGPPPEFPKKPVLHSGDSLPSVPPDPMEDRRVRLQLLSDRVAKCDSCPGLFATRTQPVFGHGLLGAKLALLTTSPSDADDAAAAPLSGEPGALLEKMLAAIQLQRDQVYITNMVKCRGPGRPPRESEWANCRAHLMEELTLIAPRFVCCLGEAASQAFVDPLAKLSDLRGRVHSVESWQVVCTFHPADLLANPGWKRATWEDLQLLQREMKAL